MTFEAMTLGQIAAKYNVSKKTLKKWISEFIPDLKPASDSRIYTPLQVSEIVAACGEWPEK